MTNFLVKLVNTIVFAPFTLAVLVAPLANSIVAGMNVVRRRLGKPEKPTAWP